MSALVEIRAPADDSEGTRLRILRWLRKVGERVELDEPLLEIETDKVTVEVPAPGAGVLRAILRHAEDEVVPGEVLGQIDPQQSTATLVPRSAALDAAAGATPATEPSPMAPAPIAPAPRSTPGTAARAVSPAVRRLLAEHGLDLAAVRGTGEGGRVTVEDVLRAGGAGASADGGARERPATAGAAAMPAAEATLAAFAEGAAAPPAGGDVRRVPHTAVRRRIAEHMVQSLLHTAPHVTSVFEADLSAVLSDRSRRREEFARRGAPLTLSAYFVRATVAAIRAVPEANSRWTDSALELYDPMHIGVATAVEGTGLVVPVLRDAQRRDLFEIAQGLDELIGKARGGRLAPADVRGGTFTISNHGVSGSLLAAPIIINQGQAAILGVGKLEKRPVVVEGGDEEKIVVRPRCYVTLTLDHRIMDGHQANRFLQCFVAALGEAGG